MKSELAAEIRERWQRVLPMIQAAARADPDVMVAVADVPVMLHALGRLRAVAAVLEEQRAKLQAFKGWVHAYLDAHGVPHHPPGTHGAEGCRIGDRLDWVFNLIFPREET